jgi:DNA-directed RNA polymerase subunit D
MNIEMAIEKGNKMEFLLKGGSTSFANLIRRFGMGQVPVFAIDSVTFYENGSAMFDEYVAHRIGQVPLVSDSASKAKDEILLTLDAQGPSTVYTKELRSSDSKIRSALDNIPLLKLLEGQNIRLEAKARRGIGRTHAKWQAGLISYEALDNKDFKFKTETFLQLEPRDFLMASADAIITRCDELDEKLSDIKKSKDD